MGFVGTSLFKSSMEILSPKSQSLRIYSPGEALFCNDTKENSSESDYLYLHTIPHFTCRKLARRDCIHATSPLESVIAIPNILHLSLFTACFPTCTASLTALQHLPDYTHQRPILQRSCYPFLISQLPRHLFCRTMRPLFNPNVDSEARGQSLLEPYAHTEANNCGEGAVRYSGREKDSALG